MLFYFLSSFIVENTRGVVIVYLDVSICPQVTDKSFIELSPNELAYTEDGVRDSTP